MRCNLLVMFSTFICNTVRSYQYINISESQVINWYFNHITIYPYFTRISIYVFAHIS